MHSLALLKMGKSQVVNLGFGYVAHWLCCIAAEERWEGESQQQKTDGNVKAKAAEQNEGTKPDGECTVLPLLKRGESQAVLVAFICVGLFLAHCNGNALKYLRLRGALPGLNLVSHCPIRLRLGLPGNASSCSLSQTLKDPSLPKEEFLHPQSFRISGLAHEWKKDKLPSVHEWKKDKIPSK